VEPHADGGARGGTAGASAPAGPRGGAEAQAAVGAQPGPRLELLWEWGCEATEGLTATCLAWCKARKPHSGGPPCCSLASVAWACVSVHASKAQTLGLVDMRALP